MTTVKQRQGSSQANLPAKEPKTKSRDGAKAETKEPKHGVGPGAAHTPCQKVAGAN